MIDLIYVSVRWNLEYADSKYLKKIKKMQASDAWEKARLDIWKRYTMPSLLRQTHREFEVLLLCDPAKKGQNKRLAETLTDRRFRIITDWEDMRRQIYDGGKFDDTIMICRLDSDDMYHPKFIETFIEWEPKATVKNKAFIQAMTGYGLNTQSGAICEWNNPSPPFFAILRKRWTMWKDLPGGQGIAHHGKLETRAFRLSGPELFCVTMHGMNICNRPGVSWVGRAIKGEELERVKADYGIK
jgi:hypothetical protein